MERIPALRRLSDSALRITSATASDGRLAALALYRLGAAARAAEAAAQAVPALASSSRSSAAAAADPAAEAAAVAAAQAGVNGATAAAGTAGVLIEGRGEGIAAQDELDGGEAASGGAVSVPPLPSAAASAGAGTAVKTKDPGSLAPFAPDTAASKTDGSGGAVGRVMEGVVNAGMREERGSSVSSPSASAPPLSEKEVESEQPRDDEAGLQEQPADADAAAAQARDEGARASSSVAAPTASPVFDMDAVRGDQRFEQLVEIVECVASDLSVSDISKASDFQFPPTIEARTRSLS